MKRQNILVPNNLSEITLGQYQRFARINEKEENEKVLERKMIEIFCSIDAENVKKIEYKSLKKIVVLLSDVINKKPELVKRFKIDKQEFGFIPKLDDMSFGEFVDLDTSLADWDTMHLAMGVLYRPIKNKLLDTYTVNEYKYGWYSSIYAIAQGDLTKFDQVTKLNIHSCFTFLSFEKQKLEIEGKRIKNAR